MAGENAAARLKAIFSEFDTESTYSISRRQLVEVLTKLSPDFTPKTTGALIDLVDKNGDGRIDYSEFVDFLFLLSPDAVEVPLAVIEKDSVEDIRLKTNLFDPERWMRVASGAGAWGFQIDEAATAMRNIVRNYPDLAQQSPEGLTLAEEFVLVWQDKSGDFEGYNYFGADEAFHHAIFGACLLGLRARGTLEFRERHSRWIGKHYKLILIGSEPADSEVLAGVYRELEKNEDMTMKEWFEAKSGKWGQDSTTQLVIDSLEHRGVFGKGHHGQAAGDAHFTLLDKELKAKVLARLERVVTGEERADSRSVALLALCRTADMRDMSSMVLMEHLFGDRAKEMTKRVDDLVLSVLQFKTVSIEDLNNMIDALPVDAQQQLCSDKFWEESSAEFKSIDVNGSGAVDPKNILNSYGQHRWPKCLQANRSGMADVCLMFDMDNDGKISEQEYVGFKMWAEAMKMLTAA